MDRNAREIIGELGDLQGRSGGRFSWRRWAKIVGGKFDDGFTVSAAGYLFNAAAHPKEYASADAAAADALKNANPRSIAENREYGRLIYEDADGNYNYTGPTLGTARSVDPYNAPAPEGTLVVGEYHTHGDYSAVGENNQVVRTSDPQHDSYDSNNFGFDDLSRANWYSQHAFSGYKSYLGNPSGIFKVYDPQSFTVTQLKMNSSLGGTTFLVLISIMCVNVAIATDSVGVEKVPEFTEHVTITGAQAKALTVAIEELVKWKLDPTGYLITVHQSESVFVVTFDSPAKRLTERGAASTGPPGFEVTVSRPSLRVLKAHFMR